MKTTITTTEYLPIVRVSTYDGHDYQYPCGSWGTKEEAEKAIEKERGECEGEITNSFFETQETEEEIELTEKQFEIWNWIANGKQERWHPSPLAQIDDTGRRVWLVRRSSGHRVARSLAKKGLVKVAASNSRRYNVPDGRSGYASSHTAILDWFAA